MMSARVSRADECVSLRRSDQVCGREFYYATVDDADGWRYASQPVGGKDLQHLGVIFQKRPSLTYVVSGGESRAKPQLAEAA